MSQEVTNPGVAVEQQQAQNDNKNEHRQGSDDLLTHLTARTTFLISSSVAFLKSWSKGLASSLKSPTSSQFFRKRVGVGVWSAREETLEHRDGNVKHPSPLNIPSNRALTCNDNTVIPSRAKLQGHLMFVFVYSQVVFICESLCKVSKNTASVTDVTERSLT